MQMLRARSKNSSNPAPPIDKVVPVQRGEPMKAVDEPSAVNRLLMSDVTTSWSRTFRALLMLMGLVVLGCVGIIAVLLTGSSLVGGVLQGAGVGP